MKAKCPFILSVLVLAAVSFACQFSSPLINLFATPTPTATATFTPSPTPSPTPTASVTPTPLPSGRIKEKQSDGSTLFTDYDGKYQITLPSEWTVVITQPDDIEEILNSVPSDSDLKALLEPLKNSDNDILRVFCFNFKNTYKGYTPNINIGYQTNFIISEMSIGDIVNSYKDILPTMIKGLKVVDTGTNKTSSEIDIGYIKTVWVMDLADGRKLDIRQKQIYFKSGNGIVIMTFSEGKNPAFDLEPEFDEISNTVQLLGR